MGMHCEHFDFYGSAKAGKAPMRLDVRVGVRRHAASLVGRSFPPGMVNESIALRIKSIDVSKAGDLAGRDMLARVQSFEHTLAAHAEHWRQRDQAFDQRGKCPARVSPRFIRGKRDRLEQASQTAGNAGISSILFS
jgi:hypothetical protein